MTGPELKARRRALGLTQAALAELMGYARRTGYKGIYISQLESNRKLRLVPHFCHHFALLEKAITHGLVTP